MAIAPFIPLAAVSLAVALSGCTETCDGPACEGTWDRTVLAVHDARTWDRSPRPKRDASALILGTTSQGVGWSVAALGGAGLVGLPDRRRVARFDPLVDEIIVDTFAILSFVADDVSFGTQTLVSDRTVVVSAPDTELGAGAVIVFRDVPEDGVLTRGIRLHGSQAGDHLGASVRSCPDTDGDGVNELLIAAPTLSGEGVLTGGVYWVTSRALDRAGPSSHDIADIGHLRPGDQAGDRFGTGIACGTDLNQDGIPDVVVGAPFHDGGRGSLQLLSGAALASETWESVGQIDGSEPNQWLGSQVAFATDADGALQVLVASPGDSGGRGRVERYAQRLFLGVDIVPTVLTPPDAESSSSHFGRTLNTGDINGDGVDDVLIGAPDATVDGDLAAGRLYVWTGQSTADAPSSTAANHIVEGTHPFERVGRWTSLADTDGDGVLQVYLALRAASQ